MVAGWGLKQLGSLGHQGPCTATRALKQLGGLDGATAYPVVGCARPDPGRPAVRAAGSSQLAAAGHGASPMRTPAEAAAAYGYRVSSCFDGGNIEVGWVT